jgi:hypothetical protein
MRHVTPVMLAVDSVGLLGLAAWQLRPDRPSYSIDQPDRVIDSVTVGQTHQYAYRIRNLTNRPLRVVGAEYT